MAGIKAFPDRGERRFGYVLPRAGDRPDIGPRGGDLHQLGTRRRGRDVDAARNSRCHGVGSDRGAGIARRILVDRSDPGFEQMIEHDRRAAVLEGPGRHL